MKIGYLSNIIRFAGVLGLLVFVQFSCRKTDEGQKMRGELPKVEIVPELLSNRLEGLPGAVYQAHAKSPIRWQPWEKATFERAKASNRLLFCVVGMSQQPDFFKLMKDLESDPKTVEALNTQYVPVIMDAEVCRELGILGVNLCNEVRSPVAFPLLIWMTYDQNPVAWTPVAASQSEGISKLFEQSDSMIMPMWREDLEFKKEKKGSGYILRNSASDNKGRRARYEAVRSDLVASAEPAKDVVLAIRQLTSFYDTYSHNFDGVGGLLPSSSIELISNAAMNPGLPMDLRKRCREVIQDFVGSLMVTPMFDPLDGGVFPVRSGASWSLPFFMRDSVTQSKILDSLLVAYRLTGDPRMMNAALDSLAFIEKNYRNADGMYHLGLEHDADPMKWTWTVDDVEKLLGVEDARWWIGITGMRDVGNLPIESDPKRMLFRRNALSLKQSVEEMAAAQSMSVKLFRQKFDKVRDKLLDERKKRLESFVVKSPSYAVSSFMMVSVYSRAYTVTGRDDYRQRAVELFGLCRKNFERGGRLCAYVDPAPKEIVDGRAMVYVLAQQAALDIHQITGFEDSLSWAAAMGGRMNELFLRDGILQECSKESKIIDLPIEDRTMIFGDSTLGLMSMVDWRMASRGRPLPVPLSEVAGFVPSNIMDQPIMHSDMLQGMLERHYPVTILLGAGLSEEFRQMLTRLPLRGGKVISAAAGDRVPDGEVRVLVTGGGDLAVKSPETLREVLLLYP